MPLGRWRTCSPSLPATLGRFFERRPPRSAGGPSHPSAFAGNQREEARQREVAQAKALAVAEQEKAEAMECLAITQKRRAIFASVLSAIAIAATIFAVIAWRQSKESEEKAILSLVSGQELLQEDVDKAFGIMKGVEDGLPRFAQGMRQKAESYVRNDDFKSALIAVNAANKADPTHKPSKLYSASINIQLGNKIEAVNNLNTFLELDTNSVFDSILWVGGASLVAKTADAEFYKNYCSLMFKRFSSLENKADKPVEKADYERVAKGALMLPSDSKQINKARGFALKAIEGTDENTGFFAWFSFCVGLAEYRSGNFEESVKWCNESLEHTTNTHFHHQGLNNIVLSMIYFKTSRQVESEEAQKAAEQALNSLKAKDWNNHDTVLIELLLKERELLGSNNSPKESK